MPASPIGRAHPEPVALTDLRQAWGVPSRPRPIVIIGAGAIVRTAHLPVYQRLEFPVAGLFDVKPECRSETAQRFGVRTVFASLDEAARSPDAVFDLAVPGDQIAGVLEELPSGRGGADSETDGRGPRRRADDPERSCRDRRLIAAHQLPAALQPEHAGAPRSDRARGTLGDIVDIEVRLVVEQPWHLWAFLEGAPRLEVLYHSIHYLDAIRGIAGEPRGVYCRAVAHPSTSASSSDTRSSIILDYGDRLRCSLMLNHTHRQDATHRASLLKVEGTRGAALLTLGVNLDYPTGPPDTLEVALDGRVDGDVVCAARGSSKRSRDRCRTCSASSPAKTLRSSRRSTTRSRRWRWSRRVISRAQRGGTPIPKR